MVLLRKGTWDAAIRSSIHRDYPTLPLSFEPGEILLDAGCIGHEPPPLLRVARRQDHLLPRYGGRCPDRGRADALIADPASTLETQARLP